mmetsp:Transcript_39093/g.76228  ORF Transcript_39093/g.76228 Transcript_39093/m.76228 type:complete len:80 (+) Transcript_39093:512-751(+)
MCDAVTCLPKFLKKDPALSIMLYRLVSIFGRAKIGVALLAGTKAFVPKKPGKKKQRIDNNFIIKLVVYSVILVRSSKLF